MTRAVAALLLVWSLPCARGHAQAGPSMPSSFCHPEARGDWTVAFFSNGDNDLEDSIVDDMNEAGRVGSTPLDAMRGGHGLHVMMLIDTKENQLGGRGYVLRVPQSQSGELTSRHLSEIEGVQKFDNGADLNMASGDTLGAFLDYAFRCFPAEHYALVINGHGFGSRGGDRSGDGDAKPAIPTDARAFGSDATAPKDVMYVEEVARAIGDVLSKRALGALDLIALDACLMSSVEVGYAFERVARVMVASEDLEGGSGWDHSGWLAMLKSRLPKQGTEAADYIVDGYKDGIPNGYPGVGGDRWVNQRALVSVGLQAQPPAAPAAAQPRPAAAVRSCAGFMALAGALDEAGRQLTQKGMLTALTDKQVRCPRFGTLGLDPFVDLGCVVDRLLEMLAREPSATTDDLKLALLDARAAMSGPCVILKQSIGPKWQQEPNVVSGMSVFFPEDRSNADLRRSSLVNALLDPGHVDYPVRFFGTGWGDLLRALFNSNI